MNRLSLSAGVAAAVSVAVLTSALPVMAEGDMAAYQAALPALEQAGGGKACTECFMEKWAPSPFNKAFAVSPDGAYGGRWSKNEPMDVIREKALDSCRKKPNYNPDHPCVLFFENDKLVWKP